MPKIRLPLISFLLTVPLMAQGPVTLTSSDGPGNYVPLIKNASALNTENLNSPIQLQDAIIDQSAVIHNAAVEKLPDANKRPRRHCSNF